MTDLRERLAVLDDASAPDQWAEIERRPPRLERRIDPSRGRRISAAVVALAVAVGGTILAVGALTPGDPSHLDASSWTTHTISRLRVTFRHPPDWYVQPFDEQIFRVEFAGALVSNVDHTFRHPDLKNGATSAWSLGGLPETAVAISIERIIGGSLAESPERLVDTPRPLDLDRARFVTIGGGWEQGAMPIIVAGGRDYVRVWFGPEASKRDREIARRIVASIEPAPITDKKGGSGDLRIEEVKITDPLNERSEVEAQVELSWSQRAFPGVRMCTFIARDGEGHEVGRYEDLVFSLNPSASFPIKIGITSPARSVDGECGPRLDVGVPYRYDISNIRITGNELAVVEFDANWAADGQAGAVTCRLIIRDEAGSVVGTERFNLVVATGAASVTERTPVRGTPAEATLSCVPFED